MQSRYDAQRYEMVYDLHRVVAEFARGECGERLPQLLESAYKFYCTGKAVENPKTLEDLRSVLEAQYFAFQLGNYEEAADLIMDSLEKYLQPWGHWSLYKSLCEQILPHVSKRDRRYWLQRIGYVHSDWGNWHEAERYFRDALAIAEEEGIKSGISTALGLLGDIERNRGNWNEAERLYRQSLQMRTELGDRSGMASSYGVLGDIERNRGNWEEAERLYRQKLEMCEELGDRQGMSPVIGTLGDIERNRGNWNEAERLYRQSLEMRTELGDRSGMASSYGVLGNIERNRGNWNEAERLYRQSLEIEAELGDRSGMAISIGCLGENELGKGNLDEAEKLLTDALQQMEALGMTWHIAETNFDLARLWRDRDNLELAQQYYQKAHDLYSQLGAAKEVERIEREWKGGK